MKHLAYNRSGVGELEEPEKFAQPTLEKFIHKFLERNLIDYVFEAETAPVKSDEILRELREEIKTLRLLRYKFIFQVVLGELKGQGVRLASKCLWDTNFDNYASATYFTDSYYCTAVVFGFYVE